MSVEKIIETLNTIKMSVEADVRKRTEKLLSDARGRYDEIVKQLSTTRPEKYVAVDVNTIDKDDDSYTYYTLIVHPENKRLEEELEKLYVVAYDREVNERFKHVPESKLAVARAIAEKHGYVFLTHKEFKAIEKLVNEKRVIEYEIKKLTNNYELANQIEIRTFEALSSWVKENMIQIPLPVDEDEKVIFSYNGIYVLKNGVVKIYNSLIESYEYYVTKELYDSVLEKLSEDPLKLLSKYKINDTVVKDVVSRFKSKIVSKISDYLDKLDTERNIETLIDLIPALKHFSFDELYAKSLFKLEELVKREKYEVLSNSAHWTMKRISELAESLGEKELAKKAYEKHLVLKEQAEKEIMKQQQQASKEDKKEKGRVDEIVDELKTLPVIVDVYEDHIIKVRVKRGLSNDEFYNTINELKILGFRFEKQTKTWVYDIYDELEGWPDSPWSF